MGYLVLSFGYCLLTLCGDVMQVGSRLARSRNYAAKDLRFIVDVRALMLGCSGLG